MRARVEFIAETTVGLGPCGGFLLRAGQAPGPDSAISGYY
jgi:hypothetical protein